MTTSLQERQPVVLYDSAEGAAAKGLVEARGMQLMDALSFFEQLPPVQLTLSSKAGRSHGVTFSGSRYARLVRDEEDVEVWEECRESDQQARTFYAFEVV